MQIELNKSIKSHNTLGLDIKVAYYAAPVNLSDLEVLFSDSDSFGGRFIVLGSGSNMLFTKDYDGLVICPSMNYIYISGESESKIFLKVGAGVEWDNFVEYCCDRGWGGVENLSLIPGRVGASPVQNIGAYGSEVADSIISVNYFDSLEKRVLSLQNDECDFGYRNSIFKTSLKGRAIITEVTFALDKIPVIKSDYADVERALDGVENPSVSDIRRAIISIRESKLPDPKVVGNCGSFFKNPVIAADKALSLKSLYPDLKLYPAGEGQFKIPAAWLIERCGFKGIKDGNVGVHDKQALVLLAYEGATGDELLELANKIRAAVSASFDTDIEPEVNII